MLKARNNSLLSNIQKMFSDREEDYKLRGECQKNPIVLVEKRSACISVCRVDLCSGLGHGFKQITN